MQKTLFLIWDSFSVIYDPIEDTAYCVFSAYQDE